MFNVGDKVVYPMHGAGVIESIEEKEVLGNRREYYIMRIPVGDMRVMIPLDSEGDVGLRQVIDERELPQVFNVLQEKSPPVTSNWNRRYRANMEKIKTGDILEVAEVVRNLSMREKEKGLSTGERKMLENARQILVSELVLVNNLEEQKVETMLEKILA